MPVSQADYDLVPVFQVIGYDAGQDILFCPEREHGSFSKKEI